MERDKHERCTEYTQAANRGINMRNVLTTLRQQIERNKHERCTEYPQAANGEE